MTAEVAQFLDFLWDDEEGWAYAPSKAPTGEFSNRFFRWPADRDILVKYILEVQDKEDVFVGLALRSEQSLTSSGVKGSRVVWTELDGAAPEVWPTGIPQPSLRIASGGFKHEHLYWRLERFSTDTERIEEANRGVTYQLGADLSAWDITQLLRPPATINHKRNAAVKVTYFADNTFSLESFPKTNQKPLTVSQLGTIPDALTALATGPALTSEDLEFFRQPMVERGFRSSALMRVAYILAERGFTHESMLALLLNADDRWKKFNLRSDRQHRLLGIINKAKLKYPPRTLFSPPVGELERLPYYGIGDFGNKEIKAHWIVEDLMGPGSLGLIWGASNVGKTTFALQMGIMLASGEGFLKWKPLEIQRVLYFSLDMGEVGLHKMISVMTTPETREKLNGHLFISALGQAMALSKESEYTRLKTLLEESKAQVLVIDSLSYSIEKSVNSDEDLKAFFAILKKLIVEYDLSIIIVHHGRKANSDNKKPTSIHDIAGSHIISATVDYALNLSETPKQEFLTLSCTKMRNAERFEDQRIFRTASLSYSADKFHGLIPEKKEDEKPQVRHQLQSGVSESKPPKPIAPLDLGGDKG